MSTPERQSSQPRRRQYRIGEFTLDLDEGFLRRGNEEIPLRRKTFEVLTYLVQRSGCLVTKNELIEAVWPDTAITDNSLAQCLLELRRALGDNDQQAIRTVARRGYVFAAPVTSPAIELPAAPKPPNIVRVETTPPRRKWFLAAFLVLAAGLVSLWYAVARPERPEKLAVLPFKALGAEEDGQYLGVGMADALITKLSNVSRLVVRPTASVRKYAAAQDPIAAGRELNVEAVLDGAVQRLGNRLRVTVQLVRVADGRPLWADKFDESLDDLFAVQDSISGKVADALIRSLTKGERRRINTHYTASWEAYELYVRGRYIWEQRTDASLRKAVTYFEQAVQKDPHYALAYAALAECYGPLMQLSFMSAIEALPKMEEAASRAVELDDTLADAHTALAAARMNEWDWPSTEREFKRAIALNPNEEMAHRWYGYYLEAMGRQPESLNEWKRAYELNPSSPGANAWLGWALFRAGRSQEAITLLQEAIGLNPDYPQTHERLGNIYVELRSFDKALEQFSAPDELSKRMYVLARAGRGATAQRELEQFLKLAPSQRPGAEMGIAAAYLALGDRETALSWLETAYRERNPQLMFLKVDERFSTLRSEPGFRDLLRRVRLL
jgi:TolB-like protein/DNA-binding winged helix-turn-helix (wHTH) protein/Tfp pilus assembly protein PilF